MKYWIILVISCILWERWLVLKQRGQRFVERVYQLVDTWFPWEIVINQAVGQREVVSIMRGRQGWSTICYFSQQIGEINDVDNVRAPLRSEGRCEALIRRTKPPCMHVDIGSVPSCATVLLVSFKGFQDRMTGQWLAFKDWGKNGCVAQSTWFNLLRYWKVNTTEKSPFFWTNRNACSTHQKFVWVLTGNAPWPYSLFLIWSKNTPKWIT